MQNKNEVTSCPYILFQSGIITNKCFITLSKYILILTEALGFINRTWEHHMQFFRLTINRELNISFKIKQHSSNALIPLTICPRCDMNTTILCFWRQVCKPYLAPGWDSCEVSHTWERTKQWSQAVFSQRFC